MSKSKLFVSRFAVLKSGGFVYDQKFHKGINIIRGDNTTGKSTVVDLLSYGLGSIITDWTEEQLICDSVILEVDLNGRIFCLDREIVETGQAKMKIFEGAFDDAIQAVEGWTIYSVKRSAERHSFSQHLFELLGLPRHKTDDASNLTLHQILRLMYVDQLSATTKLLKEDKAYDNASLRRAIGDYLLGIDDLEAHNLRQELISANKEFEKLNGELNAIYRLFGGEVTQINEQALNNEISQLGSEMERLKASKNDALKSANEDLTQAVVEKSEALQQEIDHLFLTRKELESEKSELVLELTDTELFLHSLADRKSALEQSNLTFSSLGGIDFEYCPSCFEPIVNNEHNGCSLCKTELPDNGRSVAYARMLNELNFQIRESGELVVQFRGEIDAINSRLPGIDRRLEETKFEYRELQVTSDAKDALIAEIASEMGFCKSQILALEDKREHVQKVESLRQDKELANKKIGEIQDRLDQVREAQAERYGYVYQSIEELAKYLLSQDGSYESAFDEVEEVGFDFAKDKMFVNGRSKFSASSMVVMKNSIRLAMFLHAVEDDDARLPNLMLLDNVEDKGMVDSRSQNFQRLIVSECQKLENDYQMIFTTSMIDPALNGSDFCVGPMYEKGMHTLEFS
ncbi:ATP-binding protein [Arenicella sp. 4NH20-0111]|uniref:hypothetical protein n=1 Tax=Arenicella sp. 4NH20-0111 TaxID=3127648 RepID=UPI0031089D63